MIEINIPGQNSLNIENIIFDLNGTLAVDGKISDEIINLLSKLKKHVNIYVVTAGTHGGLEKIKEETGLDIVKIESGREAEQKLDFIKNIDPTKTIAAGNGKNDIMMLKEAILSISVIEGEGCTTEAILSSDISVRSARDLLELLLKPTRIMATLRS